jgi:uncharacterized protein (TIGR04255 family)
MDFLGEIKLSAQFVDNIRRIVSNDFPEFEPQEQVSLQVMVKTDEREKITKEKRSKVFRFYHSTTNNSLTLEGDAIIFDMKTYNSYEDFRNIVKNVIQNVETENQSAKLSRTGLRYINQLILDEGNPFDWNELIKEPLISSLEFIDNRNELARLMGVIELNRSDYFIRFQYGWYNSEFPNPIAKKEFALDYDCYSKNEIDISEVLSQIDIYHAAIKELFEYSKEDGLQNMIED